MRTLWLKNLNFYSFWHITFFSLQSNQNFVYITLQSYSSATFHVLIAKVYGMT